MDLLEIDNRINEILNGTRDLPQFNKSEHAGVCSAGPLLIGALIVCDLARRSLESSGNASNGQGKQPFNWEIDECQEQALQEWAEAKGVWIPEAEEWLNDSYGPRIAEGAEAIVYAKSGDTHVIKLRSSIYAILSRGLEAIALHNYLFPETIMNVIGFTRDAEGILRVILTQPYIACKRLATIDEINAMVFAKGFRCVDDGHQVNFISPRLHLEDMHPANVFIETQTGLPVCIDCIVKFVRR